MTLKRLFRRSGLALLSVVILIIGGWCALAVWFRFPAVETTRGGTALSACNVLLAYKGGDDRRAGQRHRLPLPWRRLVAMHIFDDAAGHWLLAERAGVARSTVAEAIKALEFAGVLSWQNRIVRIRERCRDLFGHDGWRWRVIRTSNAYVFRDPASKSDQRTGTPDQGIQDTPLAGTPPAAPVENAPQSPLERALARFAAALAAKAGIEQGAGG